MTVHITFTTRCGGIRKGEISCFAPFMFYKRNDSFYFYDKENPGYDKTLMAKDVVGMEYTPTKPEEFEKFCLFVKGTIWERYLKEFGFTGKSMTLPVEIPYSFLLTYVSPFRYIDESKRTVENTYSLHEFGFSKTAAILLAPFLQPDGRFCSSMNPNHDFLKKDGMPIRGLVPWFENGFKQAWNKKGQLKDNSRYKTATNWYQDQLKGRIPFSEWAHSVSVSSNNWRHGGAYIPADVMQDLIKLVEEE